MNIPSSNALLNIDTAIKVIRELCEKVDKLEKAGFVTQENIVTGDVIVVANQAMPDEWLTATDMEELIAFINNDNKAIKGTVFLSTVSLSDLPASMVQAELKAEVLLTSNIGKVILFTVTSNNTSPYHWEYTSAWGEAGVWRAFTTA